MSVKNKIELEFAGLTLPVVQDEDGRDVVPLKPISDVFGLKWETQRTKVRGPYLSRRLGVVTPLMGGGHPPYGGWGSGTGNGLHPG